jgi:hypothetical protein
MESIYLQALFETNRKTEIFHNIKDYPRMKKLGNHTKPQKNKQNKREWHILRRSKLTDAS